jgi:hypothetical protein
MERRGLLGADWTHLLQSPVTPACLPTAGATLPIYVGASLLAIFRRGPTGPRRSAPVSRRVATKVAPTRLSPLLALIEAAKRFSKIVPYPTIRHTAATTAQSANPMPSGIAAESAVHFHDPVSL